MVAYTVPSIMAPTQMDAVSSFTHLAENIPSWLVQLTDLSSYTSIKNAEFVAEYSRLVKAVKPKRIKSPSICSIHSDESKSAPLPQSPSARDAGLDTPDSQQVDPLEAGNRHLYADQVQRKRKTNASMKSGASGPQRFRSKHQVIIYYDSHVQGELDALVKSIGIARNNLRKGKNALTASRGFRLPNLSKRYDDLTSPSLENIRSMTKYRSSGLSPGVSKFSLRTSTQQPQDEDEAVFLDSDKVLEQAQNLFETAAHQFLRDGDCIKELDGAKTKLTSLLEVAKTTAVTLQEKAQQREAEESDADVSADVSQAQSVSEKDCPSLLTDKSSIEPLVTPPSAKTGLSMMHDTLDGMRARGVVSAPPATSNQAQTGMTIEVDDGSDAGSFGDINLDISQFRTANRLRMRG